MLKVYNSNILTIFRKQKKPFYSVSYNTLIIPIFLSIQPQYSWADTKETLSSMEWQSCGNSAFQMWFNDPPPSELLCGYVNVPLRYNSESSATHPENKDIIRLAATLLPARGKREGALITVTGGPGIPGINPNLSNEWPVSRLREMWDIIGYDPRGVGQSIPKIKCTLNRSSPDAESTILMSENWAKDKVKSCLKNTGAQFLQHIGTDEAVNDLDRIRQAVGELRLTAISWSYGTKVAATYAERFPEKVRALVLDGVVNLAEDDYTQRLNQSRAYQHSFNRFTTWCSRNGSCPLPPNSNKALVYYWDLLNRLNRNPLIAKDYGQITASDLLALTGRSLLWSSEWPVLATAIRQFDAGITSEEIVLAMKRIKQVGDEDALNVITCADTARPFTDKKTYTLNTRKSEEALHTQIIKICIHTL